MSKVYWVVVMVRTNKLIGEGTVKISGTSKAMAWVAGAAVAAGVALATPLTELNVERCRSEGVGSMWVGSLRT